MAAAKGMGEGGPDVEKVVAPGRLAPRRNLGRRRILLMITAFVAKIKGGGLAEDLTEGLTEDLGRRLSIMIFI